MTCPASRNLHAKVTVRETSAGYAADPAMTRVTSPRVVLDGVSRRFGDQVALDRVSVTVDPGQFVAIVGKSGAGKTTLLRCLAGAVSATTGRITMGADDLGVLRGRALRRYRARSA